MKIRLEGQTYLFDSTVDYVQGAIVISPNDGELYRSNKAVSAGTAFDDDPSTGDWVLLGNGADQFVDEDDNAVSYSMFFNNGVLGVRRN